MANPHVAGHSDQGIADTDLDKTDAARPEIRTLEFADLSDALRKGYDDFAAHPTHRFFLTLMFPVIGLVVVRFALGDDLLSLVFPLLAGFALIGPFAAIGMYGLSRRHETHPAKTWRGASDAFRSASIGAILVLGLILLAIFFTWLSAAQGIYDLTLGGIAFTSLGHFVDVLFGTSAGWTLIIVGNSVGALFAIAVLTISVVSFPMLVDKHVGVVSAIETSFRAVAANPKTMAAWGLIVASALVIGFIPLMVGLTVIFPVLGHATWHLYRKVVAY